MLRKIILSLLLILGAVSARAQFAQGTKYVGASISGLGLSYSGSEKFRLGLDLAGGYFVADCLQVRGSLGYTHTREIDDVTVGAGARYYFDQCGVYLGTGLDYVHYTPNSNDLQIPLEVGYAFFLNRYITLEPSIYYRMSTSDFSDKSTVGLRLGLGFYF